MPTQTQWEYMMFIESRISATDNFPTIQVMANRFGVTHNAVNTNLRLMKKKGLLEQVPDSQSLMRTHKFKQLISERYSGEIQ